MTASVMAKWEPNGIWPDTWHMRGQRNVIALTISPMRSEANEPGYYWSVDEMTWLERLDQQRTVPCSGWAKTLAEAQEHAEAALAALLAWREAQRQSMIHYFQTGFWR